MRSLKIICPKCKKPISLPKLKAGGVGMAKCGNCGTLVYATVEYREKLAGLHTPLRVFICHTSQDIFAARMLTEKLARVKGLSPWLDEEELKPGVNWNQRIREAVASADAAIICWSHNAIANNRYFQ